MSNDQVFLPTEILIQIISHVAAEPNDIHRQASLYVCCLVSRQWYSVAVAFLYEKPRLGQGVSFSKFTATISPPIGTRRGKYNLGGFVRRLDLSPLVHHSSNSLTARLLGRIKENLEVFIAPRVSFAINALPALSKSINLRHLDLALVGDSIPFPILKKALSHLSSLTSLRLPMSTSLTDPDCLDTSIDWPPLLERLQLSGKFSRTLVPAFPWPPKLNSLTLKNCADLSLEKLSSLISNPHLGRNLKRLTISGSNRGLQPESIYAIPSFLPDLTFLKIPGDLVTNPFFEMLHLTSPLSLEVLELGYPHAENQLNFETTSLVDSLDKGLENLCAVGFSSVFYSKKRDAEDEEIDDILLERDRKQIIPPGVEEGEDYDLDNDMIGVYYM